MLVASSNELPYLHLDISGGDSDRFYFSMTILDVTFVQISSVDVYWHNLIINTKHQGKNWTPPKRQA